MFAAVPVPLLQSLWKTTPPGGTTVTVIVAVPLRPSLVAVIVAVPTTRPVTSPLPLTVATPSGLLAQVTVRPVRIWPAASFSVTVYGCTPPTGPLALPAPTLRSARVLTPSRGAPRAGRGGRPAPPLARRRDRRRARPDPRHQPAAVHRGDGRIRTRPRHHPAREGSATGILRGGCELPRLPHHHAHRGRAHRHRRHGHGPPRHAARTGQCPPPLRA